MSLTEVNIDIAECMNNVCGASTMPYKVMRIDFLRWIWLIIRCSLDLILRAGPSPPPLYDSIRTELTCMLQVTRIHLQRNGFSFVFCVRKKKKRSSEGEQIHYVYICLTQMCLVFRMKHNNRLWQGLGCTIQLTFADVLFL